MFSFKEINTIINALFFHQNESNHDEVEVIVGKVEKLEVEE